MLGPDRKLADDHAKMVAVLELCRNAKPQSGKGSKGWVAPEVGVRDEMWLMLLSQLVIRKATATTNRILRAWTLAVCCASSYASIRPTLHVEKRTLTGLIQDIFKMYAAIDVAPTYK